MKYIKAFDSLRAFAVTIVLVWHFIPRHDPHTLEGVLEQFLLPTGVFGVTLFFVLSGYLISNILLDLKFNNSNGTDNTLIVKNFIIRRSLRIFPIYYLLIIILLFFDYPFSKGELPYLLTYTSNIFMFKNLAWSNFGHSWSLSVEEQFYLFWPWLILFLDKKYLKYVFVSFILIGITSSFLVSRVYAYGFNSPSTILTTSCLDAFGIGGIYAFVLILKFEKQIINRTLVIIFCASIALSFYWKLCPYLNIHGHLLWLNRTINCLISLSLIHFTLNNRSFFLQHYLLENRFFNLIGRISYGMYLYHWPLAIPLIKIVSYLKDSYQFLGVLNYPFAVFIIKFAIVFIVSYLSYELIEKRILKLKLLFDYNKKTS